MLNEHAGTLAELREMRKDVLRALSDIWRGALLFSDGMDVTAEQKLHLEAVVVKIDASIAEYEFENRWIAFTESGAPILSTASL